MASKSDSLKELADQAWNNTEGVGVKFITNVLEEIVPSLAFIPSFGNVIVIDTNDGLVMIDTSGPFFAEIHFDNIRNYSSKRLHTVIFTHGHVDHVGGVHPFDEEAKAKGWSKPCVIAQDNILKRFERYKYTHGYNQKINQKQFQSEYQFPSEFRYPDRTYQEKMSIKVGEVDFHLFHDKGETDDSTWVWIPKFKTLCTGDLFIWASPNCGNPQKVQRYPKEWSIGLKKMLELGAEYLLPGHGPPIYGKDRVEQALRETIEFLEDIVNQTVNLINKGCSLDTIIHSVKPNQKLMQRPYLSPVYDEPAFIIRNLWRLYAGWWDQNPAHLKPAKESDLSKVICQLSGGALNVARKAKSLLSQGKEDLSSHLIEFAFNSDPENLEILKIRQEIYQKRAESEKSLMASNIYRAEALKSQETLNKLQAKL